MGVIRDKRGRGRRKMRQVFMESTRGSLACGVTEEDITEQPDREGGRPGEKEAMMNGYPEREREGEREGEVGVLNICLSFLS